MARGLGVAISHMIGPSSGFRHSAVARGSGTRSGLDSSWKNPPSRPGNFSHWCEKFRAVATVSKKGAAAVTAMLPEQTTTKIGVLVFVALFVQRPIADATSDTREIEPLDVNG